MMEKQPNLHSPSFTGVCCKIKNFKPLGQIKSQKIRQQTCLRQILRMKLPISRPVIAIGTNAEPTSRRSSMLTSVLCGQTQAGSKLERTLRQVLEYFAESTRVFAAEYDSTRRTAHLRLAVRRPMRCAHVRLLVHAPPSLSSGPVRGVPCARAPVVGATAFTTSIAPRYIPYGTKTQ